MSNICLVDFSQLVIAAVAAHSKDLKTGDPRDMIKHIALNIILGLRKKFPGNTILCCDSRSYWRKDEFPYYKGHRKHRRADGFLDWELVYEVLTEIKQELKENFPYIVLEMPKAEADDLIAVLTEYFQENELTLNGLVEEPATITICSSDEDFMQLQKYKNVQQWNNLTKKFNVCKNPAEFLMEHICTGDTGDNVPNICTGDDWAQARAEDVKTKARPFSTSRFKDFHTKGVAACLNENELRNFKRNELLVDLSKIPVDVKKNIIDTYKGYVIQGNRKKIFQYLIDHRMKLLQQHVQEF